MAEMFNINTFDSADKRYLKEVANKVFVKANELIEIQAKRNAELERQNKGLREALNTTSSERENLLQAENDRLSELVETQREYINITDDTLYEFEYQLPKLVELRKKIRELEGVWGWLKDTTVQ